VLCLCPIAEWPWVCSALSLSSLHLIEIFAQKHLRQYLCLQCLVSERTDERVNAEKRGHRDCGNGEEEREGCCIKGATASDYIHKRAE
jgi:hypothetical protein